MTDADLPAQPRVIRVFISSTFRDMQAERDELVKRVFPQLRKLCEQRGVTWGEVDLRWGVTDEQSAEGQVLPICLEEIRRCRPYFIGLLGERYGWIPGEIPGELIEQEPWLAQHRDHSVTELEILHGVLNDPGMADRALFYFRSPAYVESLPIEQQSSYREEATSDEIKQYGLAEAQSRAEERRRKLEALKARIRGSGLPLREGYPTPQALGELILTDLTAVVDRLYPEGSQPDPLDCEVAEHDAFATSRAGVYIGRQAYFDRLDAHVQGDAPPLVVLGESGAGKSALLANWARHYRARFREVPPPPQASWRTKLAGLFQPGAPRPSQPLILMHFIGATPYSADWAAMLRRIMAEFKRRFDIRQDIPDQSDALRSAFANWLHIAAAKGRVVLIIDALNQLEDRDGAPDLVWLPPAIPANVRLILSTLPGRPLDDLKKRGWATLQVEPLTPAESQRLITEYLAQYTKALGPTRIERIARAPQAANPLYLRALLEELRLFGVHEKLDQRIDHYLAAATMDALYEKVLERYEEDYERDRPGLVREALSLLWAARRGLSETELLELLGSDGQPLPRAYWSPLFLAAEQALVNRSGLIGFFHDHFRQAVRNRYLPTEQNTKAAHLRLAGYFDARDLGARKVDELPWQLAQAQDMESLYKLLADLEFVDAAWRMNPFDIKRYWSQVESNSPFRLVEAYRSVIEMPAQSSVHVPAVATLLKDTGHLTEALALREYEVKRVRQNGDGSDLAGALVNEANILYDLGNIDRAVTLYEEAERSFRAQRNRDGIAKTLVNQALILIDRGNLSGALERLKDAERLCRELGDYAALQTALGHQANILNIRGDSISAVALLDEQERLCRQLGDERAQAAALTNHAILLKARGELDDAMKLHRQSELVFRSLGDLDGLQATLGNEALILQDLGDWDGALALHEDEERICRRLGKLSDLAVSLGNQASIRQKRGDLEGALSLFKEEEQTYRLLQQRGGLARSLNNQGTLLKSRGERDRSMELFKQSEQLYRALGDKNGLARSLGNQASVLQDRGDWDRAMALYEEVNNLFTSLGDKSGRSASLNSQGSILFGRGDLNGAMRLYQEAEKACRDLGDQAELQRSLAYQGQILQTRGDEQRALTLFKESERICRELGDKNGLADALVSQGVILARRGDHDRAMAVYREAENIYRAVGSKAGLQCVLGNQGALLQRRGEPERAMGLHRQSEGICRELGDKVGTADALMNQAIILKGRKDFDGAMSLLNEAEHLCQDVGARVKLGTVLGIKQHILYERHDPEGVLKLAKKDEKLRRDLEDTEGLAESLATQASMLYEMRRPHEALPLAEQAYHLADQNGFRDLAQRIKRMVDDLRRSR